MIWSFKPDANDNGPSLLNDIADNEAENFLESLIRFDQLVGKGRRQIPPGAKIVSATLRLSVYDAGSGIVLQRALESWDEKSTWKSLNRGLDRFVAIPDARLGRADKRKNVRKGMVALDVTSALRAWVQQPRRNFGWVLKSPAPGGTNSVGIRSSEFPNSGERPQLTVRFTPPDKR